MRLIRCEVISVRRHREFALEFAPGLTVIGGANESGKSSLVEAMHRTLFVRAASSVSASQDLRSQIHAGHPQIKIEFETSEQQWTLLKCFSGPSGTTQLKAKGQVGLTGSAAEDQLAKVLGIDEILTSRQVNKSLPTRWAHLWVKQGESGRNLLSLGHEHYDLNNLIECLEQQAEKSLQSPLDQRVHTHLERLVSESLSTRGVRQQSLLWKRQEALKVAKRHHLETLQQLQVFEVSCEELDHIEQQLQILEQELLPELRQQRQILSELQEALRQLKPLRQQNQQLERSLASRLKLCTDSTVCEKKLIILEQELKDLDKICTAGNNHLKDAQIQMAELEQTRQALEERGVSLRQMKDRDALQRRVQFCNRQDEERRHLTSQQHQLSTQLKALEGISPEELLKLTKTQEELRAVVIRIESMASKILVESSDQTIAIEGSSLQQGESCEQTGVFRIDVGDNVRLRISPGEGTGLASLEESKKVLQIAFKTGLNRANVGSLVEAQQCNEQRNHLLQQQALLKAQLNQINSSPDTTTSTIEDLRFQLDELNQILKSKSSIQESDLDEELKECRNDYRELVEYKNMHQKKVHQIEVQQDARQKQWQQKCLEIERLNAEQQQRLKQRASLEEEEGSQEQLTQLMHESNLQKDKLERSVSALLLPTPTQWHADPSAALETLDRQERQLTEQRHDLGTQRGALLERCESLGRADLHSAVDEASVKLALAEKAEQEEALLIRARSHLLRRFQEARSDLSQRYSSPLKRNIDQILKPLLQNSQEGCSLRYDTREGLQELSLQRDGTLFNFNQLSGGMKEQLNAAVRIAIADTLKEHHGGCLPLLFDDAFTNTDTVRLDGVLNMLQYAVKRGLQVIVLSCDSDPYKSVADKIIMID